MSSAHSKALERISTREALLWGLLIGVGDTYLGAFAVFLLASPMQLALISTLPQLGATLGQFLGLAALQRKFARPRFLLLFALLGAACWFGISLLGFIGIAKSTSVVILLLLTTIYYLSIGATAPPWNGLIGDGVHESRRSKFFEQRNAVVSICTAAGFIAGGLILQFYDGLEKAIIGFAVIFLLAGIARFLSALLLGNHPEVSSPSVEQEPFSLVSFFRKAATANFARFAIFFGSFHIALGVAIPFFTQYMLRDLDFSYLTFMVLVATNLTAQFLAFLTWGRLSARYGNRFLMLLCAYGVALTPALWVMGVSAQWIFAVQFFAGFFWGGFALGALNFLFLAVTPPRRARCSAYLAFSAGTGVLIGGILGGAALEWPFTFQLLHSLGNGSELCGIFIISATLRFLVCIVFLKLFREVAEHEAFSTRSLAVRIVHSRPFSGINFMIVHSMKRFTKTKPKDSD